MMDGPIRFHWICNHLGINDGFTLNSYKGRFKKNGTDVFYGRERA